MTYSPAGIILTWNAGAEGLSGYSAAEAIGAPMAMLFPPGRLAHLERTMKRSCWATPSLRATAGYYGKTGRGSLYPLQPVPSKTPLVR